MAFSQNDLRRAMRLYAVTDNAWLDGRTLAECVSEALAGGATFVQLRVKGATTEELVEGARELIPLCRAAGVPFVIDDDVEAARLSGADGVHVGQEDLACAAARAALGPDAIVGVSAQTVEQALAAQAAGADYLGVGAVIPTPTKPDAVDVTRAELQRIVDAVDIPVVAIGGLNQRTIPRMKGTGIDGVAVVSAIFAADDIRGATQQLVASVDRTLWPEVRSVLSIAGSDSSGGAGLQADIKTCASMGVFAQTAVTALTAQNTMGVTGVHDVPGDFVQEQIDAVFADIRPDAVKIGMVGSAEIVDDIVATLRRNDAERVVVDPVLVATSGAALAEGGVAEALRERLFPLADVITPNLAEAEALCGFAIECAADAERAADVLAGWCPGAVLVKGGHGLAAPERVTSDGGLSRANEVVTSPRHLSHSAPADDLLRLPDGRRVWLLGERVANPNAHGTGCTLSSAIACGLAQGLPVEDAVRQAKSYITGALQAGLDLGQGSGPLNHMWNHR